jgi:uncharacterized protein with beta-barrel porin domain
LQNRVQTIRAGTALTVSNLTGNIAPASGVAGIRFASQGGRGSDGEMLPIHGTNANDGAAGSTLNLNITSATHSITTTGANAYGIMASSVGGDGGTGGVGFLLIIPIPLPPFVIPTPGFGGEGGNGGVGGQIDALIQAGIISTAGAGATGVLATSQAGSGGDGGYAVGIYGGGGDGGVGGTGGAVNVTLQSGAITTQGEAAHGIAAQSTGGPGGAGGSGDGAFGSGGTSLGSGPGGAVTITNSAGVTTTGVDAYGLFAQSQGGASSAGGRSGGLITWGAGSSSAGAGGNVTVTNHGVLNTDNLESHAILAQSIGGGGGAAGNSFGLLGSIGGDGSASGAGGTVTITNHGQINALGEDSVGIYVQSVGGGGGLGGKGAGLFAFGGSGAVSGAGGPITLINHGAINAQAQAIFAESLGGGGGNGGTAGSVLVSIGGKGSSSGDGGVVNVTNDGQLDTAASDAAAIHAWSTGGGGGFGGSADTYGPFIAWSNGGDSSVGAIGGNVTVNQDLATLHTRGDRAHGIDAVSLGGGGGGGGDAFSFEVGAAFSMSNSFGGSGSGGGNGGLVTVNGGGEILTDGDHAHGIRAASIGGGGGGGGKSAALSFAFAIPDPSVPATPAVSGNLSLGGKAGGGGASQAVIVDNDAGITTAGYRSHGILAQSVGGGGGDGGQSFSGTILFKVTLDATINIGASGGLGGKGASVDVTNSGLLETSGNFANGILAQSVGGGGGSGGAVATLHGSLLGGIPLVNTSSILTVGGSGGNGGGGEVVDVDNLAGITTHGDFANGILAQSIGGGGGYGSLMLTSSFRAAYTGGGLSLTLGARQGGVDGGGGLVTVDNLDAAIHTEGHFAHAILAQSVGGGGGYAAASLDDDDPETGPDAASIHGGHSGSGAGGQVTVTNTGTLSTTGDHAYGILAQSVGGGGGYAALRVGDNLQHTNLLMDMYLTIFARDADNMVFLGSTGGSGAADSVTVSHTGSLSTQGQSAHGIVAHSAGGWGAGAGVTVTVAGDVTAQGDGAHGVYARASGGGGAGDVDVTLESGTIQGGAGAGAGVVFSGGGANLLTNRGTIFALSGMAVRGDSGNETIDNHGRLSGNIDLGAGANRFDNLAGSAFLPGESVGLGGGPLTNAGTLSPGGVNVIRTTALTGSYTQTAEGLYQADLDTRSLSADKIDATGTASLDGTLELGLSRRGLVRPGTYLVDLIAADAGVDGRFASELLPAPTRLLRFSLVYGADTVQVQAQASGFRSVASNPVGGAVADHLDRIATQAGGELAEAMAEIQSLATQVEVDAALTSLSPETHGGTTQAVFAAMVGQSGRLFGRLGALRGMPPTGAGGGLLIPLRLASASPIGDLRGLLAAASGAGEASDQGLWLDAFGRWGDQNPQPGYTGFDYRLDGLTVGYDRRVSNQLTLGASLGYARTDVNYDTGAGSGATRGRMLSFYGGYDLGGGYLDAVLSLGRDHYRLARDVVVGAITNRVASTHKGDTLSVSLNGGIYLPAGTWRMEPYAALRYSAVEEDRFSESGAGGISLIVQGRRTEALSAEVGARLSKRLRRAKGELTPEFGLGWEHDFRIDDGAITASYAGAPGSAFAVREQGLERDGLRLGAGIRYLNRKGLRTSLRYELEARGRYRAHGLFGELRYEF